MKKVLVVVFMAIGSQALFAMHKDSEKQFLLNMNLMNVIDKNGPDIVDQVAALLKQGAQAYENPLVISRACRSGNIDLIKLLIDNDADVNKKNKSEYCLFQACRDGNYEVVRLLVEHNAVITYDSLVVSNFRQRMKVLFYLLRSLTRGLDYKSKKTVLAGHFKNEGISPFAGLSLELIKHIVSFYDKKSNIGVLKKLMDRKNDSRGDNLFDETHERLLDASFREILDPKSWSGDQQAEKTYARLKNLSDDDLFIIGYRVILADEKVEFNLNPFGRRRDFFYVV